MQDGNPDAYDVIVIGAGSAGMAAARGAASLGLRVALVERDTYLGGDCPNYACIPTKTLLYASQVYTKADHAHELGIQLGDLTLNYGLLKRHKDHVVSQTGGRHLTAEALAHDGITLVRGAASFVDQHTLAVNGHTLTGRQFVIATGTKPRIPDLPGLKGTPYLTSRTAIDLTTLPRSIAILGAGAVGVEFAQAFSAFGSDVTLIEAEAQILPWAEPELAEALRDHLAGYGVEILTGHRAESVRSNDGVITVKLKSQNELKTLRVEQLLVAIGTEPNVADLNLAQVDVKLGERGIETDDHLRTTAPHIWAAGDVTERDQFTNAAHAMGSVVGWNVGGKELQAIDLHVLPRVVFGHLELATVGQSEAEAAQRHEVVIGIGKIAPLSRALTDTEPNGLVKLVAEAKMGNLLGASILATRAGEMIHEPALAIKLGATVTDIATMIHAFPTYSEAIAVAAHDAAVKLPRNEA